LEYAHSQGIFHRDVKPSNLLLDVQGTAWVADFGLAKAVEGENLTHTGDIVGTIRYMAPERFRGKCDAQSDVYALGLTLYEMLALRPAFEQTDRQALIQQVTEQDPPRLQKLNPAVPRDLETVIHKSIDKDAPGRYPTAAVLAEDLELYLDGRPIRARSTGRLERCWKWAKRRPTVATLLAAFVIAVLTGLAAVTWQWRTAVTARDDALTARNEALSAREVAQQNFELARKAVDDYLTRVGQNPLLKEQGLHELRQELLGAALSYYRDFLRQRGDDPSVQAEAAAAHARVGDIELELGRPAEALAAYERGLALIEPLVRERPDDLRVASARVRFEAGRLQALKERGAYPDVIAAFERVKAPGEALLASRGRTEDLVNILAQTYLSAAIALRNTGRTDEALTVSLAAHELAKRATRDRPGDLPAARTRLYNSGIAAEMLQSRGQAEKSRQLMQEDIAFGEARLREHRRDVELRLFLALLEGQLGQGEKFSGHLVEALKIHRVAADKLEALARENPLIIRIRNVWANMLFNLSNLEADLGQYADAQRSARAAIEVGEAIVRDIPSNPFYRCKLGWAYGALGKAYLHAGSRGEAFAMLQKSVELLEKSEAQADLYNLACYLALASTVVGPSEGPVAAERQRRDADRAVAAIRRNIALGFGDSGALKNDPDFKPLHKRPDFKTLLMDLDFPADSFVP
jgi:tetratricopeptide (TPR) repeat protein